MTNQGDLQESIRLITGSSYDYNSDWLALFDIYSISSGTFNERMIEWLQSALNSTETNINGLKQLYAESLGVDNWNGVYTVGHALPGLQMRLDSTDSSTLTESSGSVSRWDDKSGNGYDAVQNTGSLQPTTNASTQNGLNIVDFDGTEYMNGDSNLYDIPNGDNSLVLVSKRASEDASIDTSISMSVAGSEFWFHLYSSVSGAQTFKNRVSAGGSVSSTGNDNDAFNISIMRRLGSSQSIEVNGESPPNNNAFAQNVASVDDFIIGGDTGAGFLFDGSFGEIMIYNRSLSDGEVDCINQYASNKFNITL